MTNDESMVIHVTTIYDLLKENMDTLRSVSYKHILALQVFGVSLEHFLLAVLQ